jgi:hypothetical protein
MNLLHHRYSPLRDATEGRARNFHLHPEAPTAPIHPEAPTVPNIRHRESVKKATEARTIREAVGFECDKIKAQLEQALAKILFRRPTRIGLVDSWRQGNFRADRLKQY